MIDLSSKEELAWLSAIVRMIQAASGDQPFFIAGAQARDLLIAHAHGLNTGRATMDVDFALMVESWDGYRQLRERLLATGEFTAVRGAEYKLMNRGLPVDLIPFGGVETGCVDEWRIAGCRS